MEKRGIMASEDLGRVISKWSPEEHDAILRMVEGRTEEFRAAYKMGSPIEFVKAFYEAFDEGLAESTKSQLLSCAKGCHFCCGQNVNIWTDEAAVIADYCKEHDIPIPKKYLQEQLKHEWRSVAKTEVRWCTFLKDGECSIYPVRPIACRKYLVASPPEKCDTVKYPSDHGHRVAIAIFTLPEIEVSAFSGVMSDKGKSGRLPEMLLPYSK